MIWTVSNPTVREFLKRVRQDGLPQTKAKVAYLFTETSDNQGLVCSAGASLLRQGMADKLVICDAEIEHGYPGFYKWLRDVCSRGVSDRKVEKTFLPDSQGLNTHSESEVLVRYARVFRWDTVIVVAPLFHQPRAFLTLISVAMREYPELKVYSCPGMIDDWSQEVRHSQGVVSGPRWELLFGEWERIERYHQQGDLVSPDEALDYLDRRDKR